MASGSASCSNEHQLFIIRHWIPILLVLMLLIFFIILLFILDFSDRLLLVRLLRKK